MQGPNATAVTDTPLKGEKVCRQVQLTSIDPRGLGSVYEECNGYTNSVSDSNSNNDSNTLCVEVQYVKTEELSFIIKQNKT
jgi:hypothetical protein